MSDFSPGIERARAAGYTIAASPYPLGEEGIALSLETVARKIREGRLDPDVRGWAGDVLLAAGRPKDVRAKMQALLDAFRAQTMYLPDPSKTEYVVGAATTVCLRQGLCVRARDCDDGVVMLGSAALAIGLPPGSVVALKQYFGPDVQQHVLLEVQDEHGDWFTVDPSTNLPVGQKVRAISEERIDPLELVGAQGTAGWEIVTVGGAAGFGAAPGASRPREMHYDGRRWHERRYGSEWVFDGGAWSREPAVQAPRFQGLRSLGSVTSPFSVADVLVYRRLWDPYVLGVARAAQACASAWAAQAAGQTPPTPINTSVFAVPPDLTSIQNIASEEQEFADRIVDRWNLFANLADWQIVATSEKILQSYQDTVLRCAQFYAPTIARYCPSVTLPTLPTLDLQSHAIAYLEALGIVAGGSLQLVAIGAQGAAQTYVDIAAQAKEVASKIADNSPLIAAAITVVAGAYVAFLLVPMVRRG